MKNFRIQIREELSRIVQIQAEHAEQAIENVKFLYQSEEIVLDTDDFCGEAEITLFRGEKFTNNDSELFRRLRAVLRHCDRLF